MMLPDWFLPAFVVFFLLAIAGGYMGAVAGQWQFRSILYSLQSELEVLEASLTSEIKRRAALSKVPREKDDELLEKLAGGASTVPVRQPMWWEKYANPNTKDM